MSNTVYCRSEHQSSSTARSPESSASSTAGKITRSQCRVNASISNEGSNRLISVRASRIPSSTNVDSHASSTLSVTTRNPRTNTFSDSSYLRRMSRTRSKSCEFSVSSRQRLLNAESLCNAMPVALSLASTSIFARRSFFSKASRRRSTGGTYGADRNKSSFLLISSSVTASAVRLETLERISYGPMVPSARVAVPPRPSDSPAARAASRARLIDEAILSSACRVVFLTFAVLSGSSPPFSAGTSVSSCGVSTGAALRASHRCDLQSTAAPTAARGAAAATTLPPSGAEARRVVVAPDRGPPATRVAAATRRSAPSRAAIVIP
eukprot:m.171622 g.171622  ORF g.171622 m.171622 type:complete len:323 (+) comp24249_c0_seq1:2661-3629(+)